MDTSEETRGTDEQSGPPPSVPYPSILRASERLEGLLAQAPVLDPWYDEVREAIRASLEAVAHEIDVLEGPDGMHEAIVQEEPRMIPHLQRLEASLHGLLGKLTEAEECGPRWHHETVENLEAMTSGLRAAARNENAIVHETYVIVVPQK